MPARAPAGKPPDGQGRRRGDGGGFLRAAIQTKADFPQLFRLIPDGAAAGLPTAGIAPQLLGVDALHRVRAVHTTRAKTYLIIPILILPEPDDVPLVRSFFAPEHGKAVLPVVLHRQQLDGAGPPARHLPAEEPGDLSELLPQMVGSYVAAQRSSTRLTAPKIQRALAVRLMGAPFKKQNKT